MNIRVGGVRWEQIPDGEGGGGWARLDQGSDGSRGQMGQDWDQTGAGTRWAKIGVGPYGSVGQMGWGGPNKSSGQMGVGSGARWDLVGARHRWKDQMGQGPYLVLQSPIWYPIPDSRYPLPW